MDVKQIQTITFARLSNAYHASFMSSVKAAVEMVDLTVSKIDESLIANFNHYLSEEIKQVKQTRVSDYTRRLDEYDRKRDSYYRCVWHKIKALENDLSNQHVTPELLHSIDVRIFRQYSLSICTEGNLKETALIKSFLNDVDYCFDFLAEEFGFKTDLEKLKDANDKYEELYMRRLNEKQHQKTSAELRDATDSAYMQLAYTIAANANKISTDESKLQCEACGIIIEMINSLIREIKARAYKDVTPDIEAPEPDEDFEAAADPAAPSPSPGDDGQTDFE